jgi:hypothetical protein
MRVRLFRDTSLTVKAGQIVEVDEKQLRFLAARVEIISEPEPVKETAPEPKKKKAKKPAK